MSMLSQKPKHLNPELCLPDLLGTYIYAFSIEHAGLIDIGKLGEVHIRQGTYLYCGSALGSGGIRSRITHHIKHLAIHPHWHIDWLKPYAIPKSIIYLPGSEKLECDWRAWIQQMDGVSIPIPRFGSSDCQKKCPAHLLYLVNVNMNRVVDHLRMRWNKIHMQELSD